jgi:uncharacterized membrane protein YsdA (DUF1294 family)
MGSARTRPVAAPALPGYLVLAAFAVLFAVALLAWTLPPLVLVIYVLASALTFVAYAVDKRAARTGRRRVSENTLHLFALACGWPGAIVAQQTLRHKTAKRSFRTVFWVTVFANVVGFVALATPVLGLLRQ